MYYMYKKRQQKKKQKRKYWVHPILTERENYGAFHVLFEKLREDDEKFFNYFRMRKETFDKLLSNLYNKLKHQDTKMRNCISPAERLAVTLR